jgi:putative oxidoreductase
VQRLFSTFADGWPGGGLPLQRLLVGAALIYCAISSLTDAIRFETAVPELLGAAAGALVIAGLWTPVTGIVISADQGWIAFSRPNGALMPIVLSVVGLSLAMIGPGAWSIDARLSAENRLLRILDKAESLYHESGTFPFHDSPRRPTTIWGCGAAVPGPESRDKETGWKNGCSAA